MLEGDIIIQVTEKDIYYSDEEIISKQMQEMGIDTEQDISSMFQDLDINEAEQNENSLILVNKDHYIKEIINKNNNIYIKIFNDYNSYLYGKIMFITEENNIYNFMNSKIHVYGYKKVKKGVWSVYLQTL